MLGQLLYEALHMFFVKVHFLLQLFSVLLEGIWALLTEVLLVLILEEHVAVFFSAVCSLVCFISAPHELVCKSYLQKMDVSCHESLEEFQIMTVRVVNEGAVTLCLLAGMVIMLSLWKLAEQIRSNWFVHVN